MSNLSAIILAAGEGKRMKSKYSKVLNKISGKALVECVVDAAKGAGIDECVVVVGHKAEEVKAYLGDRSKYALQEKQLGTGHAAMMAENVLVNKKGYTVVLYGDTPLITSETIKETIDFHVTNGYASTVITADLDDTTGYGKIVRDENGNVLKIVEHKDANEQERKIKEVNSGLYCFSTELLFEALKEVKNDNNQGEYYITDTLEILRKKGHKVGAIKISDSTEILGINSRQQLAEAQAVAFKRTTNRHMTEGVTIIDPSSTYISFDVVIGRDSVIYPGTIIEGKTVIGEDCTIGPNSRIIDSKIGDNVKVQNSVVENSKISEISKIGPFEYLLNK